MIFDSAAEMLDTITKGIDLWNPNLEKYIFLYDNDDSICIQSLDKDTAKKIQKESSDEYWSSYFVEIGQIIKYDEALEILEELYDKEEWFDTRKITSSSGKLQFRLNEMKIDLVDKKEFEKNNPTKEKHVRKGGIEL